MTARRILRWIGLLVGLAVIVGALVVLFVRSGIYNVAATYPDSAPIAWILGTTMDSSVKRHARGIEMPPLDDPAMATNGLRIYQKSCLVCHGAPGVHIGEVGRGLNPEPPELTEAAGDWKPNELFWITKNGVRMSGMPAWGVTKTDKEIWDIVAFARKLPKMTPKEYQALSH